MKTLLLLRHAKAAPHDEKHDKERPLADRGRRDAAAMGQFMRRKRYQPECVLCSVARRTVETWEGVAPELGLAPTVRFLDSLYEATPATILECVRKADGKFRTLLVIGHNPGLEDCARTLVRKPEDSEEATRFANLFAKYPTSGLAVLRFDTDLWRDVAPHAGVLLGFVTPKGAPD
jgi:phosphohistidine phosphatase